jgi:ABC-type Mn2+/Zn2+ transport system permease subunit
MIRAAAASSHALLLQLCVLCYPNLGYFYAHVHVCVLAATVMLIYVLFHPVYCYCFDRAYAQAIATDVMFMHILMSML